MSNKTKIILIPAIASVAFMLFFWISNVRESQSILGVSSDLASGGALGLGIGLGIALLITLKKSSPST